MIKIKSNYQTPQNRIRRISNENIKTLKHLLWFIIPTAIIAILLSIFTFADPSSLPRFLGFQNYLISFIGDDALSKILLNACALPVAFALCAGTCIFLVKRFLFKEKYNHIFYGTTFVSAALIFHFTTGLRQVMGLPPVAYSAHLLVSTDAANALITQPNIPAVLIAFQVGITVCFLYWCAVTCLNSTIDKPAVYNIHRGAGRNPEVFTIKKICSHIGNYALRILQHPRISRLKAIT